MTKNRPKVIIKKKLPEKRSYQKKRSFFQQKTPAFSGFSTEKYRFENRFTKKNAVENPMFFWGGA